jgi:hypothetical protein
MPRKSPKHLVKLHGIARHERVLTDLVEFKLASDMVCVQSESVGSRREAIGAQGIWESESTTVFYGKSPAHVASVEV